MWTGRICGRGFRRTASQEKLTKQWIDRCLRLIGAREELVAQ